MGDKDRLIELIRKQRKFCNNKNCGSCGYAKFGGYPDCQDKMLAHNLIENGVIVPPCIAMVEQFIDGSLKFDRKRTAHNGRMAVIYIDKKKHSSFPLIDITDQFYNIDTAEARIKALERSKG